MASIPGTSPSRELRTTIRGRSVRSSASPKAALFVVSMARPLREIPSARYSPSFPLARPAWVGRRVPSGAKNGGDRARDEGRRHGLSDDDHDNPADHSDQPLD